MAWTEDIQSIKYKSPSGAEFEFQYEGVSIEVDKKTAEFIFPEKDGAYIQDMGIAGRRFPFVAFFSGEEYNKTADSFLLALEEKGAGELEHPLYGTRTVVPTGTISRRDDLITEANQAAFTFTFSETIEDITFPSSSEDTEQQLSTAVDDYEEKASENFLQTIISATETYKQTLKNTLRQGLITVNSSLKSIKTLTSEVNSAYDTVKTAYENNIESVFDETLDVARQGISVIRLPSKIQTDMKSKVMIYSDCITHLLYDYSKAIESFENVFAGTNLNATASLASACESVLYGEFSTRNEAIEISEILLSLYDDILEFQDEHLPELDIVDTGEAYDSLATVISLAISYLITISFDLPSQKSIVLGEERNCIELVAEIYSDLDKLDYFIETNNLTCDLIEILPVGKEIIYYE